MKIENFIYTPKNMRLETPKNGIDLTRVLSSCNCSSGRCSKYKQPLNLSNIRNKGVTVRASASDKGSYIVTFAKCRRLSSLELIDLLNQSNPDSSFYDEDIDDNELIHKTDKPLWGVKKKGNSFVITRN